MSHQQTSIELLEGNPERVFIKNLNNRFKIVTPTGLKDFEGVLKTSKKQTCILKTETSNLKCSLDHLVINEERKWVKVKSLTPKDKIIVNGIAERVVYVKLSDNIEVYDAVGG